MDRPARRDDLQGGAVDAGPILLQHLAVMEAGSWADLEPLEPELLHRHRRVHQARDGRPRGLLRRPPDDRRAARRPALTRVRGRTSPADRSPPRERPGPRDAAARPAALGRIAGHGPGSQRRHDPSRRRRRPRGRRGPHALGRVVLLARDPGLGFPLGTRCQMFWLDPTHPSALAPGKRPRTTLTPTLVLRDGRVEVVLGTPGGDAQDQLQAQLLHALAHGWPPEDAVDTATISQHSRARSSPTARSRSAWTRRRGSAGRRWTTSRSRSRRRRRRPVEARRPQVVQVDPDGTMGGRCREGGNRRRDRVVIGPAGLDRGTLVRLIRPRPDGEGIPDDRHARRGPPGPADIVVLGEVVAPGGRGYEEARLVHNGLVDRRPALIARCLSAAGGGASSSPVTAASPSPVRGGGHMSPAGPWWMTA